MTLASWWGKVMGDMDSRSAARFFTASESPFEPPMRKQSEDAPEVAKLSSFCASAPVSPACRWTDWA